MGVDTPATNEYIFAHVPVVIANRIQSLLWDIDLDSDIDDKTDFSRLGVTGS